MMISEISCQVHFEHYPRDGMEITWSKRIDHIDMICEAMWKHQTGMELPTLPLILCTHPDNLPQGTHRWELMSQELCGTIGWTKNVSFALKSSFPILAGFVHVCSQISSVHPFIKHVWKIQGRPTASISALLSELPETSHRQLRREIHQLGHTYLMPSRFRCQITPGRLA